MSMPSQNLRDPSSSWRFAYVLVAVVCALPFLAGLAGGGCFYFRDISAFFFPLRRFVVEGLLRGEIRQWNPYLNEGLPVLAISYPFDLLQVLVPSPWGFSLLLALHVPLAGLTFLGLARRLEYGPAAAALGALVYSLSGFTLSSLNLYTHLEAIAWAPVVVWTLLSVGSGGRRQIAAASLAIAVCLSTMGIEIAIQAVAVGWALAATRKIGAYLRLGASTLLGLGLAAGPLVALTDRVSGSHRDLGFPVAVALDQSVHPVSFLQTVVAGLYGDPMSFGTAFWGQSFWNGGFPFYLSLYLGAAVPCLVFIAVKIPSRHRVPLLLLLVGATVICLGSWARLDLLLEILPPLRKFRYPVKAFFTILLASSLLAATAAQQLATAHRTWRLLALVATLVGLGLLGLRLVEPLLPATFEWLQRSLFPPSYPWPLRASALRATLADGVMGGVSLLAIAGIAVLRLRERVSSPGAVVIVAAVIAADLLRAGAGLNPTARHDWYELSPEMSREVARMREAGGRVFTCAVQAAPAYREAFRERAERLGVWAYSVQREALTPYASLDAGLSAVGRDPTDLVPSERTLSVEEEMCRARGGLAKLREMGVRHLLAVQPILSDGLHVVDVVSPARIAPLSIYVHEVEDSLPDPSVSLAADDLLGGTASPVSGATAHYIDLSPEAVRLAVFAPRPAYVILRRAHAAGWSASVDGRPAEVVLANGRHQAVRVPAGTSEVELRYHTPYYSFGVVGSALCALLAGMLGMARRRP